MPNKPSDLSGEVAPKSQVVNFSLQQRVGVALTPTPPISDSSVSNATQARVVNAPVPALTPPPEDLPVEFAGCNPGVAKRNPQPMRVTEGAPAKPAFSYTVVKRKDMQEGKYAVDEVAWEKRYSRSIISNAVKSVVTGQGFDLGAKVAASGEKSALRTSVERRQSMTATQLVIKKCNAAIQLEKNIAAGKTMTESQVTEALEEANLLAKNPHYRARQKYKNQPKETTIKYVDSINRWHEITGTSLNLAYADGSFNPVDCTKGVSKETLKKLSDPKNPSNQFKLFSMLLSNSEPSKNRHGRGSGVAPKVGFKPSYLNELKYSEYKFFKPEITPAVQKKQSGLTMSLNKQSSAAAELPLSKSAIEWVSQQRGCEPAGHAEVNSSTMHLSRSF